MISYLNYGGGVHGEVNVGFFPIAYDSGVQEGGSGQVADDDTRVMPTREGMTDHWWFGFINAEK